MNEFEVIAKVKEILKEYTEILSCNIKVYKRTGSLALTKINNSFVCINIHSFDSRVYLASSESLDSNFFKLGLKQGKLEELSAKIEHLLQSLKWSGNKTHSELGLYDASGDNINRKLKSFDCIKSCCIRLYPNRGIILENINNTKLSIYISLNSAIFLRRYFSVEQTSVMLFEADLKFRDIQEIEESLKEYIKHIQYGNFVDYVRVT